MAKAEEDGMHEFTREEMEAITDEIVKKICDACKGQPVTGVISAIFAVLGAAMDGDSGEAKETRKAFAKLLSPFLNNVPGLMDPVVEHAKAYSLMKKLEAIAEGIVSSDKVED